MSKKKKNKTNKNPKQKPKYIRNFFNKILGFVMKVGSFFHDIYVDVSNSNEFKLALIPIGFILSLIFAPILDSLKAKIISVFICFIILELIVIYHIAKRKQKSKKFILKYDVISVSAIVIIYFFIIPHFVPEPDVCDNPLTVRDYFQCDAEALFYHKDVLVDSIEYEVYLNVHLQTRTYYFSFYLPNPTYLDAFCLYLSVRLPQEVEKIQSGEHWGEIRLLDQTIVLYNWMFLPIVYIYHNANLNTAEEIQFRSFFLRRHREYLIIFRGIDYAMKQTFLRNKTKDYKKEHTLEKFKPIPF